MQNRLSSDTFQNIAQDNSRVCASSLHLAPTQPPPNSPKERSMVGSNSDIEARE